MRNRRQQAVFAPPQPDAVLRQADAWAEAVRDPLGACRAVPEIVAALSAVADGCDRREWSAFRHAFDIHPLANLLRRDPLVARAWQAGDAEARKVPLPDAVMGDLMLRHPHCFAVIQRTDVIGKNLYAATSALPACEAVRDRRRLLARVADAMSERRWGAEILALAPGYMREAELSLAGPAGAIRRWVGIVPDQVTAGVIGAAMPLPWVQTMTGPLLPSLLRPDLQGSFDLVYHKALELIDDEAASVLVVAAFARVRSGGRLLLGCRAPGADDTAFWSLGAGPCRILRDEAGLARLLGALPQSEMRESRIFRSMNEAMLMVEVERA